MKFIWVLICLPTLLVAESQTNEEKEFSQALTIISQRIEETGGSKLSVLDRLAKGSEIARGMGQQFSKSTTESVSKFFEGRIAEVRQGLEIIKSNRCNVDVLDRTSPKPETIPLTEEIYSAAGAFRLTENKGSYGLAKGATSPKSTLIEIKLLKISDTVMGIYIAGQEVSQSGQAPVEAQAYAPSLNGLSVVAFGPAKVYRVSCGGE